MCGAQFQAGQCKTKTSMDIMCSLQLTFPASPLDMTTNNHKLLILNAVADMLKPPLPYLLILHAIADMLKPPLP